MITTVLVAIVGSEVFPSHTGWWIAYAVIVGIYKLGAAIGNSIKFIASH